MNNNIEAKDGPIAVYAFSADPITYGHINIVERIAASFPKCIVGIGRNPAKKYLFDIKEREYLASQSLSHLPNVEVIAFNGMVVDFAYEYGAKVIIKGARSAADVEYEQTLHQVGVSQKLGIDTHILFADPQLAHISSSVVKGIQQEHGFIHDYVPPAVKVALEKRISNQLIIGLTGDIASGKSYLAEQLIIEGHKIGLKVHNIDLDILGHQILAGEGIASPLHQKLVLSLREFIGDEIIVEGGIDRRILSKIVFSSESKMKSLNEIMLQPLSILLRRSLKNREGLILLNGALLAEINKLAWCNYRCIVCSVEPQEQLKRLSERGLNNLEAKDRLSSQLNSDEKSKRARKEVECSRFGRVWEYDSLLDLPNELLRNVLIDCEESKWIS